MSRSQKIQIGFLIRCVKHREYHKISDDFKEVEAVKKILPFFQFVRDEVEELKELQSRVRPPVDLKAITTQKILQGGYRNHNFDHISARYNQIIQKQVATTQSTNQYGGVNSTLASLEQNSTTFPDIASSSTKNLHQLNATHASVSQPQTQRESLGNLNAKHPSSRPQNSAGLYNNFSVFSPQSQFRSQRNGSIENGNSLIKTTQGRFDSSKQHQTTQNQPQIFSGQQDSERVTTQTTFWPGPGGSKQLKQSSVGTAATTTATPGNQSPKLRTINKLFRVYKAMPTNDLSKTVIAPRVSLSPKRNQQVAQAESPKKGGGLVPTLTSSPTMDELEKPSWIVQEVSVSTESQGFVQQLNQQSQSLKSQQRNLSPQPATTGREQDKVYHTFLQQKMQQNKQILMKLL